MTSPAYGRAAIRNITEKQALDQALALLRQGEVIAIPTDTLYAVACDSLNEEAVEQLYQVKDRPRDKPIPLLLSNERQLLDVTRELPDSVWEMIAQYWPGALTLVLHAAETLPANLTAATSTVAIRLPDSRVTRVLAAGLDRPLAVSSANLSGGTGCTTAGEVFEQIGTRLPLILDGGTVAGGTASTILDLTVSPPQLLREGSVTREMLSPWLR